uniref:Signal peptide peptidase-like 3 isoform X2 n=1 Tax=Rhizophora mucronata TaxID=61149 RepID=A0A2P2ILY0_RHIMU
MALRSRSKLHLGPLFCLLFLIGLSFAADDTSYDDDSPKYPGCDHPYKLVKVENWVNGAKGETITGITAKFGALLPSEAKKGLRLSVVMTNPLNGCSSSSSKLSGSIAMSIRGDCAFSRKAEVAEAGGAAALLVINDKEDLAEMGCEKNRTALDISIPTVMISKSGGDTLNKSVVDGQKVELLLYAPERPTVDFSVILLWIMAVGTVACASLWSELTAPKETDERYNELSPKETSNASAAKDDSEKEVLDINAMSAVIFVISASTFLVLLYFFMSSWFVWILIVLFCIGGIEGMHNCIVTLILRYASSLIFVSHQLISFIPVTISFLHIEQKM